MANKPTTHSSDQDLASLQGEWEQVGFEENGLVDPPDEHGGMGAITTITGHRFFVRALTGERLLEGEFLLDATLEPKSITWIDSIGADAGRHLPASYILTGDSFVFIAADEGEPRPLLFRTESHQTMRRFARKRLP